MDLDVRSLEPWRLRDTVMSVLQTRGLRDTLASYGIDSIVPPDMRTAKQTETTQRFKVHLICASGQDLFTKVEFSRRSARGGTVVEPVASDVLRAYRAAPVLCPHYDGAAAFAQKVKALAERSAVQARDIFDLYLLDPQTDPADTQALPAGRELRRKAHANLFLVDYEQFADTVLAYLAPEEASLYASAERWDEVRLAVAKRLEETA